jgi:hypothetical protein
MNATARAPDATCMVALGNRGCSCPNYCFIVVTGNSNNGANGAANVTRYAVDLGLPAGKVYNSVVEARDAWRAPCFTAPADAVSASSGVSLPAVQDSFGPYQVEYPEGYYVPLTRGEYVERLPCSSKFALPHGAVKCTVFVHAAFGSGRAQQSFDDAADCTAEQAAALGVTPTAAPLYPETSHAMQRSGMAPAVIAVVAAALATQSLLS